MRTVCLIACLLLAFTRPAWAQDGTVAYRLTDRKVRLGDDPRWAALDGDDRDWQDFDAWYFSPAGDTAALFWTRITLVLDDAGPPNVRHGIRLSLLASYELYWDGHRIGTSGRVGASLATEVPGPVDQLFFIPDSLYTPGVHLLAGRLSTFHGQERVRYYFQDLVIGPYRDLARAPIRDALLPLFFLGGFCIIGIYYFLLYLVTTRKASFLVFSLLCFSVSVLLVAESWRWVIGYTYDRHVTRLVEEDPATGVRFIEALADEFRILSDVSGERLIPLSQELDLCRSHLALMSYRNAVRFDLAVEGVAYDDRVPPALFHTLIENGLTHNAFDADTVCFRLRAERLPRGRRYTLLSPTDGTLPHTGRPEGTGLRYVKARLEESFPGRWRLTSGPCPDGWQTIIELREEGERRGKRGP